LWKTAPERAIMQILTLTGTRMRWTLRCACVLALMLGVGRVNHVVFTVDVGPKIITCLIDGVLCDGGAHRQYGWKRFDEKLGDVNTDAPLRISPTVKTLRIYSRALRTSEAVANYKASPK